MKNLIRYSVKGCTVELPYARLRARDETVYADDGYTVIGTRYTFDVSGVLTAATADAFKNELLKYRNTLSKPRGSFSVRWREDGAGGDGDPYWVIDGPDIDWGPKPGAFEISRFDGGLAALYTWSLTATTKECFSSCSASPSDTTNVLALTRSYDFEVDQNGFTTRRVSGQLTVRGTTAKDGKPADSYRWKVVPVLPGSYERVSMNFTQSPDGRVLNYVVVDREKMWCLPLPLTSGEATFSFVSRGYGKMADCVLAGWFEAPANVSKQVILQRIGGLLSSKLPAQTTTTVIWESMSVTDHIYDNKLAFSFAWRRAFEGNDPKSPDSIWDKIGGKPKDSPDTAAAAGPYGGNGNESNSGIRAGPPTLYDACDGGPMVPTTKSQEEKTNESVGTSIDRPASGGTDPTTSGQGTVTSKHQQAIYSSYVDVVSWEVDHHIVVFPAKVKGKPPVVQQTAEPTAIVIQAGYAVREGELKYPPRAGEPMYAKTDTSAVVKHWFVSTPSYLPLAREGQYQMKVDWRRVWAFKLRLDTQDRLGMKYPTDPRVSVDASARPKPDVEDVLVVPS